MDWPFYLLLGAALGLLIGGTLTLLIAAGGKKTVTKEPVPPPPQAVEAVDVAAGEILDSLPDAVLLVDEAHFVRFANAAFRRAYPEARLPTKNRENPSRNLKTLLEVTGDERISRLARRVYTYGEEESEIIENPLRQPAGTSWRVQAALFAANQRSRTVRLLIHDITEAVNLDRVRRDFVSNASHELRTPLTIISGTFETLEDDEIPADMRQRMVESGLRNAHRMSRLIDDMLTLSQAENPGAELAQDPVSLGTLVPEVIEKLAPLIEEAGARIENSLPSDFPTFPGDPFYWEQIYYNLLENALKYRHPERPCTVTISGSADNTELRLSIEDQGQGIPEEHLGQIFRRFFRAETSHSQHQVKGTGLGLSIVKRAVEAHHGRISVDSQPGQFTKFTIRLPRPSHF
ncbi:MAG: ATP-binding protein [Verrucomicrobiales bacterium]